MKAKVFAEREKMRQVTHWDLDYLSTEEVRALYARQSQGIRPREKRPRQPADRRLPWLLMGAGALLLIIAVELGLLR